MKTGLEVISEPLFFPAAKEIQGKLHMHGRHTDKGLFFQVKVRTVQRIFPVWTGSSCPEHDGRRQLSILGEVFSGAAFRERSHSFRTQQF